MGMVRQNSLVRLLAFGIPIVAAVAAVVVLAWGSVGAQRVQAQETGGEMTLRLEGDGLDCDSADAPTECQLDPGTSFTLAVDVVSFPDPGYIGIQTYIDYGQLVYTPTDQADPEIVWPDGNGFQLRGQTCPTCVNHGATSAMVPPFPTSTFTGTVLELSMACSDEYSANDVTMLPTSNQPPAGTDGTLFVTPSNVQLIPSLSPVSVTCGVAPTATEPTTPEATALPPTGTGGGNPLGGGNDGGVNAGLWAAIAAAIAVAAGGAGVFAWRRVR